MLQSATEDKGKCSCGTCEPRLQPCGRSNPVPCSQLGTPSILVSTALLITRRNHRKYESRGSSDKGNEMQSYACWELSALIRMCVYSIYLSLKPINKASALAITDVCCHFTRPLFWWSTSCCKIIFPSSVACPYSYGNVSKVFRTVTAEEERVESKNLSKNYASGNFHCNWRS